MEPLNFKYPTGSTPLDPDEIVSLIPIHITTQDQLNEWEQTNIIEAENWVFSHKQFQILELDFCTKLHKKMFDRTWKWAGQFRQSNKNIGVFWEQVVNHLKVLLDDVKFQLENKTYPVDEIAARFHHRLVLIHLFPNGNGRHARLITDVLLFNSGEEKFSWGKVNLVSNSRTRQAYISALRAADKGNYLPLLEFVRT